MAEENKPGKPDNLIPLDRRTKDERRAIAAQGGIRSGEVRREKILMSQIYAKLLADQHNVEIDDDQVERMTGAELVAYTLAKVLSKGGSAAVSAVKEIREATEGNFVRVETETIPPIVIMPQDPK